MRKNCLKMKSLPCFFKFQAKPLIFRDVFNFTREINDLQSINPDYMVSYDVQSRFTIVPLSETTEIWVRKWHCYGRITSCIYDNYLYGRMPNKIYQLWRCKTEILPSLCRWCFCYFLKSISKYCFAFWRECRVLLLLVINSPCTLFFLATVAMNNAVFIQVDG